MDGWTHRGRDRQSDIPNVLSVLVECGLIKSMHYYVASCYSSRFALLAMAAMADGSYS